MEMKLPLINKEGLQEDFGRIIISLSIIPKTPNEGEVRWFSDESFVSLFPYFLVSLERGEGLMLIIVPRDWKYYVLELMKAYAKKVSNKTDEKYQRLGPRMIIIDRGINW